MVHVLAPQPSDRVYLPVFLNIDGAVGESAPNANPQDIAFVQYILRTIGNRPRGTAIAVGEVLRQVHPTGAMDPQTIAAIRALQSTRAPGVARDGKVSSARGYTYDGVHTFMIVELNDAMRNRYPDLYPRLDRVPDCPPHVATAIRDAVIGTNPAGQG